MEEKVGIFKGLYIAIFRPKRYKEIVNQKVSKTVLVFLFVSFISAIVIGIAFGIVGKTLINYGKEYINAIPEFSVSSEQGLIISNNEKIFYEEKNSKVILIIDSSKTIEEIKEENNGKLFVATSYIIIANEGIIVKNNAEIDSLEYKNLQGLNLNNTKLIEFYNKYTSTKAVIIVISIIVVVLTIILFIGKLIGGLILSLGAMIICGIQNKKLNYKQQYNIAMYAGTATAFISILSTIMGLSIPGWGILKIIIIFIYMVFGIKYINNENEGKNNKETIETAVIEENTNGENTNEEKKEE